MNTSRSRGKFWPIILGCVFAFVLIVEYFNCYGILCDVDVEGSLDVGGIQEDDQNKPFAGANPLIRNEGDEREETDDYFKDESKGYVQQESLTNDDDKEEKEEIGAGFLGSDSPQERNHSWPKRLEDYSPLYAGTVASRILADRGKTLLPFVPSFSYESPYPIPDPSSGIHVVTTFFHGKYHARRFSEIVASLVANLENPYIKAVHVLWEKENPAMYITDENLRRKMVLSEVKSQPTYSILFAYINKVLKRGSIAILTNADIYFDSTLRCLRTVTPEHQHWNLTDNPDVTNRKGLVFALSRRHTELCGKNRDDFNGLFDLCKEYIHSHDAFVFAPPVHNRLIKNTNHLQNRYGAENIVIWEFIKSGSVLQNPCKKLHAIHLHCTNERHYERRFIDGSQGHGVYKHGVVPPGTQVTDTVRTHIKRGIGIPCGMVVY